VELELELVWPDSESDAKMSDVKVNEQVVNMSPARTSVVESEFDQVSVLFCGAL
jgi:hypothetical protein